MPGDVLAKNHVGMIRIIVDTIFKKKLLLQVCILYTVNEF
jgi:hypothetical protein